MWVLVSYWSRGCLSRGVMVLSRGAVFVLLLLLMSGSSRCLLSARAAARWLHVQAGLGDCDTDGTRCAHDNILDIVGSTFDRILLPLK